MTQIQTNKTLKSVVINPDKKIKIDDQTCPSTSPNYVLYLTALLIKAYFKYNNLIL